MGRFVQVLKNRIMNKRIKVIATGDVKNFNYKREALEVILEHKGIRVKHLDKADIEGEFKITQLYFKKSLDKYKNELKQKMLEFIETI